MSNSNNIALHNADSKGEIILYQPNNSLKLDVLVEQETVWLTQAQMVALFGRNQSVISRHIANVFKEEEVDEKSNMHFLHIANADRPTAIYNLDVIISVGYRIKSEHGVRFRKWATRILKDYMLRGYAVNQRIEHVEKLAVETEKRVAETEKRIEFLIKTSQPPKEGIFYDGQIFDAYIFASDLIKSAKKELALIDNYVDESTLLMLSKRAKGVAATIYTAQISAQLKLDVQKHNEQYPPIRVEKFTRSHDRFLVVDDTVYHIGASLKDLGKKLFAFSKMEMKRFSVLKQK